MYGNNPKSSKKMKSCIAKSERAAVHKKQLDLFLLLTGLIKIRGSFDGVIGLSGCVWL